MKPKIIYNWGVETPTEDSNFFRFEAKNHLDRRIHRYYPNDELDKMKRHKANFRAMARRKLK